MWLRISIALVLFAALLALGVRLVRTPESVVPEHSASLLLPDSPRDASYLLDGIEVELTRGTSSPRIGSYEVAQEPVYGDLNADGVPDAAVAIVRHAPGGERVYIAAALQSADGYVGTEGFPLREAPQLLEVAQGVVRVVYQAADATAGGVREQYASLVGMRLVPIDLAHGDVLVFGTLEEGSSTVMVAGCDGVTYTLNEAQGSSAAVRAVLVERQGASGTPFVVLSGSSSAQDFTVHRIVSVPLMGACPVQHATTTPPASDLTATSTVLE